MDKKGILSDIFPFDEMRSKLIIRGYQPSDSERIARHLVQAAQNLLEPANKRYVGGAPLPFRLRGFCYLGPVEDNYKQPLGHQKHSFAFRYKEGGMPQYKESAFVLTLSDMVDISLAYPQYASIHSAFRDVFAHTSWLIKGRKKELAEIRVDEARASVNNILVRSRGARGPSEP